RMRRVIMRLEKRSHVVSRGDKAGTRKSSDTQVFFFFQAEDGIRDLIVTGVQTCALPIWSRPRTSSPEHSPTQARPSTHRRGALRSEERRVGKECRSRWSPDPCKKKVGRPWPTTSQWCGGARERVFEWSTWCRQLHY